MAEYIEREALWRAFEFEPFYDNADRDEDVQCVADELIAKGVVPVVRCKDCTYKESAYVCNGFLICLASNMEITDNDFCSYGERKDGEG